MSSITLRLVIAVAALSAMGVAVSAQTDGATAPVARGAPGVDMSEMTKQCAKLRQPGRRATGDMQAMLRQCDAMDRPAGGAAGAPAPAQGRAR